MDITILYWSNYRPSSSTLVTWLVYLIKKNGPDAKHYDNLQGCGWHGTMIVDALLSMGLRLMSTCLQQFCWLPDTPTSTYTRCRLCSCCLASGFLCSSLPAHTTLFTSSSSIRAHTQLSTRSAHFMEHSVGAQGYFGKLAIYLPSWLSWIWTGGTGS